MLYRVSAIAHKLLTKRRKSLEILDFRLYGVQEAPSSNLGTRTKSCKETSENDVPCNFFIFFKFIWFEKNWTIAHVLLTAIAYKKYSVNR